MIAAVLFEQPSGRDVWRLEVATYKGRTFGNWRRWFLQDGVWKPTREGVTIPVERLGELQDAVADWRRANESAEPPSGS